MESFVVEVFGSEYSVRADSDGDHVLRVAKTVDKKLKQIDREFRPGSTSRTAVLACMNFVDEHLAEKKETADWLKRHVGRLVGKLDTVL